MTNCSGLGSFFVLGVHLGCLISFLFNPFSFLSEHACTGLVREGEILTTW